MTKFAASTALAALLLSAPAFAQTAAPPATPPAVTPAPAVTGGTVNYIPAQTEGQWLASNFIGETVRGPNDENIGEINDVLVDKDGRVTAAIIGVGGFLGIGEKDVAVPFSSLQLSDEREERITLSATKEQLQNAPEFQDLEDVDDARTAADARNNNTAAPAGGMPPVTTPRPAAPAQ